MAKKQLSEVEKRAAEIARVEWQQQCRNSFNGVPFKDKTAKACYERILKIQILMQHN